MPTPFDFTEEQAAILKDAETMSYLQLAEVHLDLALSEDDSTESLLQLNFAKVHAAVAQAEAITRIADSLETLAKTVVSYNGMAYLATMDRRI